MAPFRAGELDRTPEEGINAARDPGRVAEGGRKRSGGSPLCGLRLLAARVALQAVLVADAAHLGLSEFLPAARARGGAPVTLGTLTALVAELRRLDLAMAAFTPHHPRVATRAARGDRQGHDQDQAPVEKASHLRIISRTRGVDTPAAGLNRTPGDELHGMGFPRCRPDPEAPARPDPIPGRPDAPPPPPPSPASRAPTQAHFSIFGATGPRRIMTCHSRPEEG